jgi:hypothetical protein
VSRAEVNVRPPGLAALYQLVPYRLDQYIRRRELFLGGFHIILYDEPDPNSWSSCRVFAEFELEAVVASLSRVFGNEVMQPIDLSWRHRKGAGAMGCGSTSNVSFRSLSSHRDYIDYQRSSA